MSQDILHTDMRDSVLWLTLDRQGARNALNDELMRALARAFADIGARPEVRAVVLTGAGDKAFCAGADLGASSRTFAIDHSRPTTTYGDLLRAARAVTVPVIGRINGHCLAGGMGLLGICDMAVAASHARFGLPEVKVGLFPMQVAALLQTMLPPRKFAELSFTGELINAHEALEAGLVNYVAEPAGLDAKVEWLLSRVVDKSPTAIRRGKRALASTAGMTFEQALAHMESQIGTLPLTDDAKEGLAAFAEKRAPVWTGR